MNVDEVLAKMDAPDANEEEIQYIIDENLRVISIPPLGVVLGVEGDKDVNSVKFKMVRYYKGIDLSKFEIRINFANANGDLSYYTVKNPTVTDDTLTFEWLVGYLVTKYKGTVRFVVRMIITDSSTGEVQQAFDTTIGKAQSLEGLLVDVPTDEKVYDIVAQLKADLTDHVNNLLKTIPEDYNELTKKVEDNTLGISELNKDKENKVDKPFVTDDGKIPRAKSGDVEWVEVGQPTDEQTNSAVTKWLDEHPEATTTVQDGSIEESKINEKFLPWIKKDYVTPEMFGAVGNGEHDDTNAFTLAIKNGKYIRCNPKAIYYFKNTVDASEETFFVLDLCGCILKNFHIVINLADDGYHARTEWPIEQVVIKNGRIGGSYSIPDDDWKIPSIQTGALIRLENITFYNTPHIVAFTNNYRDRCAFINLANAGGYVFGENSLTLDAINGIIEKNVFAKLSSDEMVNASYNTAPFAGDGWIIERCNEWHFAHNPNYNFVSLLRNTSVSIISCIQTKIILGLYSNATFISCHLELEEVQPKTLYDSCCVTFLGCYFYNNHTLINRGNVTYISCYFRAAHNATNNEPLRKMTDGKFWHELECKLIQCMIGNFAFVDTEKEKRKIFSPKRTYHYYFKDEAYTKMIGLNSYDDIYGKFDIGKYEYSFFIFATSSISVACQKMESSINIEKTQTRVRLLPASVWGHGGGVHMDVYRKHNSVIEKTTYYWDPNKKYNGSLNCPLRFDDFGSFSYFEYSDMVESGCVEPWILVDEIPNITINNKMMEANGVIITSDDSAASNLPSGYIQIKTDSLVN